MIEPAGGTPPPQRSRYRRAFRQPKQRGSERAALADLLGELSLVLVVVHAVVGHCSQFPATVVFVVNVVGHVLQVLHVGPGAQRERRKETQLF